MSGINISSLFGGLNTGNSLFGSINLSDYHSIRSGAYKKLISKYYEQDNSVSSKRDKTHKTQLSAPTQDTSGLTKMKKETEGLKSAATSLSKDDLWKTTNGEYDMDKIASAVKDFADSYNSVVDQSAKVSARDVTQQTGFMTSLTNTMSKALSKVGVTIGSDGKMSVDEDALKKASASNVKSLFSGTHSYAAQVAQNASAISSAATRNSSLYDGNGAYTSTISNMYNYFV